MATTTPNFGWSVPTSTDLVKDGATAIETLGDAIDASLVDLKGGTTGQVLAKASGTDMDFTWATDASGIPATIFDAKGDIIAASAADTAARLAVGANDTVLTADSSTATGLKWATVAAAGKNYSLVNAGGTALTGAATITVSGITNADSIMVLVDQGVYGSGTSAFVSVRINGDTASNYSMYGATAIWESTYNAANYSAEQGFNAATSIRLGRMGATSTSKVSGYCLISGGNSSGVKVFNSVGNGSALTPFAQIAYHVGGIWNGAATISSISVFNTGGNFTGGTVYVYKSA